MDIPLISKNQEMRVDKWSIFSLLDEDVTDSIRLACVFGSLGDKALFVTKNDEVFAIGNNATGMLGTGDKQSSLNSRRINNLCGKKIKHFACGVEHVLALSENGTVFNWGSNTNYQLGSRNPDDALYPTVVSTLFDKKVEKISCGTYYNLALCRDGTVFHWGKMDINDSRSNFNIETKIAGELENKTIVSITCGAESAYALTANGELYAWGANQYGEVGNGSNTRTTTPIKVASLNGILIAKVIAGKYHTLALSDEGILYGWGSNEFGQVCLNSMVPIQVVCSIENSERKIVDIAAVPYCNISAAMDVNCNVFMWGSCKEQKITTPFLTNFHSLHEVFAHYAIPAVTYTPFALKHSRKVSVLEYIKNSFNDEDTTDLTISVEDKLIRVHKTILKIRSNYFKKMFQEGWKENEESSVLEIKESTYVAYKALLEYLYTDHINVPFDAAFELLDLARLLCEEDLRERCEYIIKNNISIDNASSSYVASVHMKIQELENFCLEFIMNHFTDVTLSDDFSHLDGAMAKEIIRKAALKRSIFKT